MPNSEPEGLLGVGTPQYQEVNLSDDLNWFRLRIERFVRGGIYLLAGQPGIGKSTLGIQIALDLGRSGEKTVFILTEQSREDLALRARKLCSAWPTQVANNALAKIQPEDGLYDVEHLPQFLSQHVLSPGGKYHGLKFIILDSIQGHGLSSAATKQYRKLYEFCRACKSSGITVLLVAHVTKKGEIAGPKDLEHNVDCVLVMRKAMVYRPMFVPKNRFGPAVLKPVPLEMDKVTTALQLSPHNEAVSSVARTYLGGPTPIAEAQAAVSLPSYGMRGKITAPGLPRKEIEQLTNCISQIPDLDIDDLDYTIHCRLPGNHFYRPIMGLPVAMALIASYIQKDIPAPHVYIGEIDLLRKVREVSEELIIELWESIQTGTIKTPIRLFLPPESAKVIQGTVNGVTVVPCALLENAVFNTWPDLR
jgi:DNA repair protein RadA/Sms